MSENLNCEIIAIGTEILLGEITDTNSVFIARKLRDIGVNIYFMTTVGDNLTRITSAIEIALERSDLVITCGGLGPTVDDMTRQAVANATQRPLVFHQSLYDIISDRFKGFGVTMTENNIQQAYLPQDAILIENPVGTAPSFIVESDKGTVISLPGVPREMKYLMVSSVIPYLLEKYDLGVILARVLKTAGIGESSLDAQIGKELLNYSNPSIGLAAHHGSVDVRITAKADSVDNAIVMLKNMENQVLEKIGNYVYGTDDTSLESVVIKLLDNLKYKLKIVEIGIEGTITNLIEPQYVESSLLFDDLTSIYAYFNISEDTTLIDATNEIVSSVFRRHNNPTIVVISNPHIDENADTEQGSAIAIGTKNGVRHRMYGFGAKSELAREWLPRWALSNLWRILKEESAVDE